MSTSLAYDRSILPPRTGITPRRTADDAAAEHAWGWFPGLSLAAAVGVLLLALADNAARGSGSWATALYWGAIATIVTPVAVRLYRRDCSRHERLALVVVLGLALYLLKVMAWPLGFTFHDDLAQLRTTLDISATHHLFSPNPIVPAYSYYPGIEVVTNAVSALSGLDPTVAGFVLVGVARLVLVIALFRLFELASSSSRVAGIAALLYAANPSFVYFDAQVAYESLALPLVVLVLFGVARRSAETAATRDRRRDVGLALAILLWIAATVVTHHVSAYFLAVALVLWASLGLVGRFSAPPLGSWTAAVASIAATAGWYAFAGHATQQELGSIPASIASSLWGLVAGQAAPRQLFHASNGTAEPLATQLIGFVAVALILLALPLGARRVARRRDALSIVLLGLALLYPPSLVLRLTAAGFETSNRASEFLFLGVGYVLAVAVAGGELGTATGRVPSRRTRRLRDGGLLATATFACFATVIFLGGLVIGWSTSVRLPKPYQVGDGPRSIGWEGVETARWAGRMLDAGSSVIADSTNRILLAAYGRQSPTGDRVDGRPLLYLYRSPALDARDRAMLRVARYLVVDRRLSSALPLNGGYFGPYDFELGLRRPIPPAALWKFDHAVGLDRIYDSGNIAIYWTGR